MWNLWISDCSIQVFLQKTINIEVRCWHQNQLKNQTDQLKMELIRHRIRFNLNKWNNQEIKNCRGLNHIKIKGQAKQEWIKVKRRSIHMTPIMRVNLMMSPDTSRKEVNLRDLRARGEWSTSRMFWNYIRLRWCTRSDRYQYLLEISCSHIIWVHIVISKKQNYLERPKARVNRRQVNCETYRN